MKCEELKDIYVETLDVIDECPHSCFPSIADIDKMVDDLSPFLITSEARLKNTRETRNKEGIDLELTK